MESKYKMNKQTEYKICDQEIHDRNNYINIMQIIMYEMHNLQNKNIDYSIESSLKYNWVNN